MNLTLIEWTYGNPPDFLTFFNNLNTPNILIIFFIPLI